MRPGGSKASASGRGRRSGFSRGGDPGSRLKPLLPCMERHIILLTGVTGKTGGATAKALLGKGLVKADNFRRSDNKLAYAYLLTPKGITAKLELTRAFLRLKEGEYQSALEEIARLRKGLQEAADPAEADVPVRKVG